MIYCSAVMTSLSFISCSEIKGNLVSKRQNKTKPISKESLKMKPPNASTTFIEFVIIRVTI